MKLVHSSSVQGTLASSSEFKVAQNNVAFKVLSTSLYSDKPLAVLRELSCNALDANIEAGITDPIEITLPSRLVPTFIIKDKGLGMSKDFLINEYATLFESTKRDTNDQIGGFGIGRLSAFSMVDSYTITTVHDGKKIEALAYIDNAIPNITITSEEDTDEPSGTTIRVPVNLDVTDRFKNHTETFFQYWDNPPLINGEVAFTKKSNKKDIDGLEVYIVEDTSYAYLHKDTIVGLIFGKIIIGNVVYEIPSALFSINSQIEDDVARLSISMMKNQKLYSSNSYSRSIILPNIPIGDIEIAPNREEIATNLANAKAYLSYIRKVHNDFIRVRMESIKALEDDSTDLLDLYGSSTNEKAFFTSMYHFIMKHMDTIGFVYHYGNNNDDISVACDNAKNVIGQLTNHPWNVSLVSLITDCKDSLMTLNQFFNFVILKTFKANSYSKLANSGKFLWHTGNLSIGSIKNIIDDGEVTLFSTSNPDHSSVLRNIRILDDSDLIAESTFKFDDASYVIEALETFTDVDIKDIDIPAMKQYIKDNRSVKARAKADKSLTKPFADGYNIQQFYDHIKQTKKTVFVLRGKTGDQYSARVTNSNNYNIEKMMSYFKDIEVIITKSPEVKNVRFQKAIDAQPNVHFYMVDNNILWEALFSDHFSDRDMKKLKQLWFECYYFKYLCVHELKAAGVMYKAKWLYTTMFTLPMRKWLSRHLHKPIRFIAKELYNGDTKLVDLNLLNNTTGFPYKYQTVIEAFAVSDLVNTDELKSALLGHREDIYKQLKANKDKANDTV